MNPGEALTRKIGPLPAWGWGVAVGGAMLAVKMLRGGGSSTPDRTVIEVPTGAPYPSDELTSELGEAIKDIRDRLDDIEDDGKQVPSPTTKPPTTTVPTPKPTPKPTTPAPSPTTTTPTGTRISRTDAATIVRRYGLDPAKVFGFGVTGFTSWITSSAANYVWKDKASFDAWVRRTYKVGATLSTIPSPALSG